MRAVSQESVNCVRTWPDVSNESVRTVSESSEITECVSEYHSVSEENVAWHDKVCQADSVSKT